jgi:hypothetical protein
MSERRIGVIINGATGRLGTTQHMANLLAISGEGGLQLRNGDRLVPDLLLVGRDPGRLNLDMGRPYTGCLNAYRLLFYPNAAWVLLSLLFTAVGDKLARQARRLISHNVRYWTRTPRRRTTDLGRDRSSNRAAGMIQRRSSGCWINSRRRSHAARRPSIRMPWRVADTALSHGSRS